ARRNGIGSMRLDNLVLRRNFRSGEHLVHWFNDVFPSVLPAHDDPFNGAVSYSEAVAAEQHRGHGDIAVHPVFGARNADEAETAATLISELLDKNPDDDVAVLIRQRTQLPELLSHLRDAGIGYQAIDIDRLTDLPEIIDLLALTRALAHPGDRIAWLGLLRSPWVGLDWTDLWTLVYGASRSTVPELLVDDSRLERLSEAGRAALERALPAICRALVAGRSEPFHQRIERAWFDLGGPALLADASAVANVNHFIDSIARIEVGGTLEDVAELETQLDEDRVSTNAAARVQVLTMHKAKGLQFDHVVLYGLGRHPAGAQKSVMIWYDLPDTHGIEEKVISPVGPREAVEHDPVHRFIELTEAAKDAHETGRLLYVACTRAIKSLHLVGHVAVKSDGSEYRPAHSKSLLSLLWPTVESDYKFAWESDCVRPEPEEGQTWFAPVLRRIDPHWTLPPPKPLPVELRTDVADTEHVDYYWVGVDARLAGTIVHRWLQLAAEGKVDLQHDLGAIHETTERWLKELGASPDAAGRVRDALSRVAADDKGQWILEGEGAAELALSGVVGNQIRSIVIDRVRVDDDGTHWIVDYKTSSHEGGDLDGFLAAESDRYREQLSVYAELYGAWTGETVRCALYFPLLSRFVEVDVASELAH
nr:3'-5' exonuclease [Woeseiaceae bacterium]